MHQTGQNFALGLEGLELGLGLDLFASDSSIWLRLGLDLELLASFSNSGYLAPSRQYGNAMLEEARHKEKDYEVCTSTVCRLSVELTRTTPRYG